MLQVHYGMVFVPGRELFLHRYGSNGVRSSPMGVEESGARETCKAYGFLHRTVSEALDTAVS